LAVSAQDRLQNEPAYKEGECLQLRAGVTTGARRGFSRSSCLHQNWFSVPGTPTPVSLLRERRRKKKGPNTQMLMWKIENCK